VEFDFLFNLNLLLLVQRRDLTRKKEKSSLITVVMATVFLPIGGEQINFGGLTHKHERLPVA
jgi:hypothetical protein